MVGVDEDEVDDASQEVPLSSPATSCPNPALTAAAAAAAQDESIRESVEYLENFDEKRVDINPERHDQKALTNELRIYCLGTLDELERDIGGAPEKHKPVWNCTKVSYSVTTLPVGGLGDTSSPP